MPFLSKTALVFVNVVGPAFVMLTVGSLAFFLLEIVYHGVLRGRIQWILAIYTFGTVLVSRISIQMGNERAAFYRLLVFGATLLVGNILLTGSFVTLFFLLAVVWWASSQLTWDCTLLDSSRDTTGQGIIEHAVERFEKLRNRLRGRQAPRAGHSGGKSTTEEDDSSHSSSSSIGTEIWNFCFARRRDNSPGLWAFYFLLAGLPIFGLGQLLIKSSNLASHQAASIYFSTYMLGALCLLMVTSLLSLHRYLSKHRATLPTRIARRWLIWGTCSALLLLCITFWLPRPTPDFSLGHLVKSLTSSKLGPTSISIGNDGQKKKSGNANLKAGAQSKDAKGEQNDSTADNQNQSGTQRDAKGQDGSSGKSNQSGKQSSESGTGSGGKKDSNQQGKSGQGGKQSGKGSSGKSKSKSSSTGGKKPNPSSQKDKQGKNADAAKSKQNTSQKPPPSASDKSRQRSRQSETKDRPSRQRPDANQRDDKRINDKQKNGKQKNKEKSGKSNEQKPGRQKSNADSNQNSKEKSSETSRQSKPWSAPAWLNGLLNHAVRFGILIACVVLAIKYRKQLGPTFRAFLAELLDIWRRLWNRKPKSVTVPEEAHLSPARPRRHRRFAEYQNPFRNGQAAEWPAEQIIAYTFEALEAWATENRCGRSVDQTPLEFTKQVGQVFKAIARSCRCLAELYGQTAYSSHDVPRAATKPLSQLWDQLAATQRP